MRQRIWFNGKQRGLGASLAITGVLAAACGGGGYAASAAGSGSSGYGGSASPAPAQSAPAAAVSVRNSSLGRILTDSAGRTLYLFEKDTAGMSTCYGSCAGYWPPATAAGPVHAGGGAVAASLTTTPRRGGGRQLTYAGHPLYYFVGDQKPGSVLGEGLKNFGGGWYVVAPSGKKIDND